MWQILYPSTNGAVDASRPLFSEINTLYGIKKIYRNGRYMLNKYIDFLNKNTDRTEWNNDHTENTVRYIYQFISRFFR